MKKNYIIPETMSVNPQNMYTYMQTASDPHVNDDGNVEIPGEGGGGNADDGCVKERNAWDEGGLWSFLLILLFFVAPSMSLRAQVTNGEPDATKTIESVTFTQLDGNVVTVSSFSEITVLPGVGLKIYATGSTTSVDYLFCQMSSITYTYTGGVTPPENNANANWNITGLNIPKSKADPTFTNQSTDEWAWRLEYPHINTSSSCQRVVKACGEYGITYSLEWDNAKIANRWTCYTLNALNSQSKVDRTEDFKSDPVVTTCSQLSNYSGSGFSRGHLCPSADRLCSKDQNKQTFFLTNMQPQWQNHNGVLWEKMEYQVRAWGTNTTQQNKYNPCASTCDTLYVVKAATISDYVTINGTTTSGTYTAAEVEQQHSGDAISLPVPRYFYMAILHYNKSTNTYRAIAFWTVHQYASDTNAKLGDYAISIDELEARTGIDFFCNLPDDIEATVESETPDLSFWKISTSNSTKERPDDDFFVPEEEAEEEVEIAMW